MSKLKQCSFYFAVVFPIPFLLVSGCSEDSAAPPIVPFVIVGTVTDTNGDPIVDALVLLDLSFESSTKAFTSVNFDLPEAGHARVDFLNWCRDEVFSSKELDLPAGQHSTRIESVDAEARQLTDGAMWILVTTSAGVDERPICLLRNVEGEDGDYIQWDYSYLLDHVRIQAITDSNGRYEIVDPCLGFGEEVLGGAFAWQVRAWAYHANYVEGAPSAWTNLDQESGGTANIVIQ